MELKPGMIVVERRRKRTRIGTLVKWATGSEWTHCWMVTVPHLGIGVEADLPRIRRMHPQQRIAQILADGGQVKVLDRPTWTAAERAAIVATCDSYVGRLYDIVQCLYYLLFGKFVNDGTRRMVCSRTMTASVMEGARQMIFDPATLVAKGVTMGSKLFNDLLLGWATPRDIALYSNLTDVTREVLGS